MFELLHIMTMFRGVICRGSWFHSHSECSMCGQHQGLVDVVSCLPLNLVHSLFALALLNLQLLHSSRVLFIEVANIWHYESIYSGTPEKESGYSGAPDNVRNCKTDSLPLYKYKPLKSSLQNHFKARLESHSPRLSAKSCPIYPVIVLHLIL